jgi:mycothiol synthase
VKAAPTGGSPAPERDAAAIACADCGLRGCVLTDPVVLPDAPALAGLSFRHIRGQEDAEALCAVRVGSVARDATDLLSTSEGVPEREQMSAMLSEAVADHEQDQWLAAQIGVDVVGYSRISFWPESDGTWVYLTRGWVLPEWRGKGIGTAMLHWTEGRIRNLAAAQHPGEKCEFAANASSTEPEAEALLLNAGYRAAYTVLEMGLDASVPLPAPTALPAGIELRPASLEHFALIASSIQAAYQHEYAAGRFGEVFDATAYIAGWQSPVHDPRLWQVAWDADVVAGQVMCIIEDGRAAVFEVSVRPEWRRHGLARALLLRALYALRARGVDVIRLHTSANFRTRARDLYQSVGFRVLKEFPRYRKPLDLPGA